MASVLAPISERWAQALLAKPPQPESNLEPKQPKVQHKPSCLAQLSCGTAARGEAIRIRKYLVVKRDYSSVGNDCAVEVSCFINPCISKTCPQKKCVTKICPSEIGEIKIRARKICAVKNRILKVGAAQVCVF